MASASLFPASSSLSRFRLAIAGGGVLGLGVAALAARRGARVTVFEPGAPGDNASGVAAGMVSPALEAVFDGREADYGLFQEAYDAWPSFAEALGLSPLKALEAGALCMDDPEVLDRLVARLDALGVATSRLGAAAARQLQPALSGSGQGAVLVRRDGRLDPVAVLDDLARCVRESGGLIVRESLPVNAVPGFDATVLACGYQSRLWVERAPELAVLQPIKGHVLHFQGGATGGPVVRGPQGYAAPQRRGTVFGATMEIGRDDTAHDPAVVARLHDAAASLFPQLAQTAFTARAGVRASTPDGRPLAGLSAGGLHLVSGARRNGWLLAPVIAAAVVDGLVGSAPRPEFDPARFRR